MPHPRSPWTLDTLRGPQLVGPGGVTRVDKRAAAMLAYLALEGPQSRARMAALLWPDSPDRTGRANLRQLLRRLGQSTEARLLDGDDPLALTGELGVDVARAREQASEGDHGAVADLDGGFFAGVDLDAVHEDLAGWLAATRTAFDQLRVEACHQDAARLERDGDGAAAIARVQRALWIDPLSEASYRQLMRLSYLGGDSAAAIAAFTRCKVALRDGLGIEPSAETVALADEIRQARARRHRADQPALPLVVQRPPRLIGRDREWAQMSAAWAEGKGIVLAGAPGVGKSRLMREFLDARARPLYFRARPGDGSVPYGTHARTYRELIAAIGGADALPTWARNELARILPQLGTAPGPIETEEDRLRFWSAKIEAHRIAHALGYDALGFDDLQFVDPASAVAGQYVLAQVNAESDTPVRTIHCYRAGELAPDLVAMLHELDRAGIILHLELAALEADAAAALVRSLALPAVGELADQLADYSGGNPLLMLESVKHVLESGGDPAALPGAVASVIGARLARLSAPALDLARALAVARDAFSFELAARVTDHGAGALTAAWTELEAARIVRARRFAHDLVAEAVVAATPAAALAALHARTATALEAAGGAPGRITAHWHAAGDTQRAARSRRLATRAARSTMLEGEAAHYFDDSTAH